MEVGSMHERSLLGKKPPTRATVEPDTRLLVGRREAANMLSISERALDYLIASKQLSARRIGARVLLSTHELRQYAMGDHPGRLAMQRTA